MKEKGLVDKCHISNLVKKSDLITKLATLVTNAELTAEQDKIAKLQAIDLKGHFVDNDTQNYLVFQPIYRYFKRLLIAIKFQRGNHKNCLMTVLNLLLHLIVVLIQC